MNIEDTYEKLEEEFQKFVTTEELSSIPDTLWIVSNNFTPNTLPSEGFKLHISATIKNVLDILKSIKTYLDSNLINYKIIKSIDHLMMLNRGLYGYTQIGKAITIYPIDKEDSIKIAFTIDNLTKNFHSPKIPTDNRLHTNSIVHYRYGSFFIDKNGSI
ncbi:class III lanthionine synthetase LanKC N-terminal domain-containing protein [Planococcus lenghuensis]|uniref:class III lanthionine synthetase LanKC N-terminal domain-containing protein n=1 Tax=Planococcus lenghuensis TaxID=2213202 RepID=UPI0012EBF498|nr:hypothetical protein [Planococcus lenghuensis]